MVVFRFIVAMFVAYLLITAYERYKLRKSVERIHNVFSEINERMDD